jgi:hypothetical protein
MEPVERITVRMKIEFEVFGRYEHLSVGSRQDTIVYTRRGNGPFQPDPKLSTATPREIELFYSDLDQDLPCAQFVKFNFTGLTALAKAKDNESRAWIDGFLKTCADDARAQKLHP